MTLARSFSVSLVGLDGHIVEIEADLAQGLPGLTVTGLPDAALAEARDRVRAAVVNSGRAWPQKRITLGLSPQRAGASHSLRLIAAGREPRCPLSAAARDRLVRTGCQGAREKPPSPSRSAASTRAAA